MECRARDLHDFFNVASQTVDVRKSRKIVMESKIVSNTTYKTHIKNVRIMDHEKKLIEKIAKLLSHSIYYRNVNDVANFKQPAPGIFSFSYSVHIFISYIHVLPFDGMTGQINDGRTGQMQCKTVL